LGIAHRDLKAENCLLTTETPPNAKVIDFGLSAIRKAGDKDGHWMGDVLGTPSYIAPEIIQRRVNAPLFRCFPNKNSGTRYGVKVDVWALGVLLYYLFTGGHPFNAEQYPDIDALFKHVLTAHIETSPLDALGVAAEAQSLICKLLVKDPQKRPSSAQILEDKWLSDGHAPSKMPCKRFMKVLRRASGLSEQTSKSNFRVFAGFEQAIMTLVVRNTRERELDELRDAFMAMDRNGEGTLTREEVATGFASVGLSMSDERFDEIFQALDADGSGKIDYTEWLAATVQPSRMASEQALTNAFEFFDSDHSGLISEDELCSVLGEHEATKVLKAGDQDGDGKLTRAEFDQLVRSIVASREGIDDDADATQSRKKRNNVKSRPASSDAKRCTTQRKKFAVAEELRTAAALRTYQRK